VTAEKARQSLPSVLTKVGTPQRRPLKAKIGSRAAIAYYIRVFNDERRFASADAIANRSRVKARLAEAQRGLDRMIDAVAAGTITTEEASDRIPKLRAARDQAKAELAAVGEPPKVVSLHPTAIKDYLQNPNRLADIIGSDLAAGDDGLVQALRALVETVTIMPRPPARRRKSGSPAIWKAC
jgi:hypothetical protein